MGGPGGSSELSTFRSRKSNQKYLKIIHHQLRIKYLKVKLNKNQDKKFLHKSNSLRIRVEIRASLKVNKIL